MTPREAAKRIKADVRGIVGAGAQRKLRRAAAVGAKIIADAMPVDRGTARDSVRVEKAPGGWRIFLGAPHALALEVGSRPHTPPLRPLVEWVQRHSGSFGVAPRAARSPGSDPFGAGAEVVAIARAIQRKIQREGTRPHYFVRNAVPRIVSAVSVEFSRP